MGSSATKRVAAALGACLAAAALSGLLLLQHHGEAGAVTAVNRPAATARRAAARRSRAARGRGSAGCRSAASGSSFYLSLSVLFSSRRRTGRLRDARGRWSRSRRSPSGSSSTSGSSPCRPSPSTRSAGSASRPMPSAGFALLALGPRARVRYDGSALRAGRRPPRLVGVGGGALLVRPSCGRVHDARYRGAAPPGDAARRPRACTGGGRDVGPRAVEHAGVARASAGARPFHHAAPAPTPLAGREVLPGAGPAPPGHARRSSQARGVLLREGPSSSSTPPRSRRWT